MSMMAGEARSAGLERLRAADLAAVHRDRAVERHVLRLEGHDAHPAAHEHTREPGDERGLAGVGGRALDHERAGHGDAVANPCAPRASRRARAGTRPTCHRPRDVHEYDPPKRLQYLPAAERDTFAWMRLATRHDPRSSR
jgi:hypothetical protein